MSMGPSPFPIFGPHHAQQIANHMSDLERVSHEITKAEAAGLNVAAVKVRHSQVKNALQKLHSVYFASA